MLFLLAPLFGAIAAVVAAQVYGDVPWPAGWILFVHAAIAGAWVGALLVGWWARRLLRWASAVLGVGLLHFVLAPSAPSVTVVVIDCMRADLLNPEDAPNLESLAASSWRFTQARAASSWTRSSMPALMSGRPPVEHGLYRVNPPDRIRENVTLLAQSFQQAGWYTAAFLEQAQLAPAFGYKRGFDRYRFHAGHGPELTRKALVWHAFFRHVPRYVQLHYLDIHGPYTPEARWRPAGLPKTKLKLQPSKPWRATIKGIRAGRILPTADDWAVMRGRYQGEMRELDDVLRWLWQVWGWDGTLENGWLVVTADHGEQFGEHGAIEHQGPPWDAVIRVPLLIRPPGGQAATIDAPVSLMDVLPTLLTGVGLPVAPEVYGQDLAPLLSGGGQEQPGFAEEHTRKTHHAAVWWQGYKLMRGDQTLLFDLRSDPHELSNLAESHPAERQRLEGVLAAYFQAQAEGRPVATVDWEAAATSGAVWSQGVVQTEAATPSSETMEALEMLGYMDGD